MREKVKPPLGVGAKYVQIVIDENGATTIEAHGFNGVGCREATAGIEGTLGTVKDRKQKREAVRQQVVRH
jgi:hypothetical protein